MLLLFMPMFGSVALFYAALVIGSLFYEFIRESIDRVNI